MPTQIWSSSCGCEHERMQDQPAAAGLPVRPRRMLPQTRDMLPGLAAVVAAEQAGRLDAGIEARRCARARLQTDLDRLLARRVGQALARMASRSRRDRWISRPPGRTIRCRRRHRSCRSRVGDDVVHRPVSRNRARAASTPPRGVALRMNAPFLVPTRTRTFSPCQVSPMMIAAVISIPGRRGRWRRLAPSESGRMAIHQADIPGGNISCFSPWPHVAGKLT